MKAMAHTKGRSSPQTDTTDGMGEGTINPAHYNPAGDRKVSSASIGTHGLTEVRGKGCFMKVRYFMRVLFSISTGRFLSKHMARNLVESEDIYDALQNQWATVGLIDALLMSIASAFASVDIDSVKHRVDGVEVDGSDHCENLTLSDNFDCTALYASLACVVMCIYVFSLFLVILNVMLLNTLPKDMASSFVYDFKRIMGIPEVTMIMATGFFILQSIMWAYLTYTANLAAFFVFLTISSVGLICLLMIYMVLVLDKPNGIWERSSAANAAADRRSKAFDQFKKKKGGDEKLLSGAASMELTNSSQSQEDDADTQNHTL